MVNSISSILQEEINNSNQIILYFINGGWKTYETSARNLSNLLGDISCRKETFQEHQFDTLFITQEILIERDLVEHCYLLSDNLLILKTP